MRKADIINLISEKTGVPKVDVLVSLEAYFKEIKSALSEKEPVYVRGFGTFALKKRKAKPGRNITAGTKVEIPEHYIPYFKPSKEFKDEIKRIEVTDSEEMLIED